MKGGKIPDYIFKSAQLEEAEEWIEDDNVMSAVLDRIQKATNARESDIIEDEKGVTKYFIAESVINVDDIEKVQIIGYLAKGYENIENDKDLEMAFREYLTNDFMELPEYSQNKVSFFDMKDFFDQLAKKMTENYVGSSEILDVTDKTVSFKDNEIYVGFEFSTHETNRDLEDKFLDI